MKNQVYLKYINFEKGILSLHFLYHHEKLEFNLRNHLNEIIKPIYKKTFNTVYDLQEADGKTIPSTIVKYQIDVHNITEIIIDPMANLEMIWRLPFVINNPGTRYFDYYNNELSVAFQDGKFIIDSKTKGNFKYKVATLWRFMIRQRKMPLWRLLIGQSKYILINDRPNKAGDNGEAIFTYINQYHKNDLPNVYYVIDKKTADYKRLKKIGSVIAFGSLKHKYYFLNAKMIVTSHTQSLLYKPFDNEQFKLYADLLRYKLFWLQHGVIYADLSSMVNKYRHLVDRVLVSTTQERKELCQDKYLYEDREVLLTGLPRFDKLISNSQNIITIAPTWRRWLSGEVLKGGKHRSVKGFEASDFYQNYKALLTNKKLLKLLKDYNFQLHFFLHPGSASYKEYFDRLSNEYVKIIPQSEVIYSKAFNESNLFITDYSSIFFDFAYLRKPLIHFQFDAERFMSTYDSISYFKYDRDAFGAVIDNVPDLIKKIEYYFNNNFTIEKKYLAKIEKAFPNLDQNNAHRVYEEMLKLINNNLK